MTQKIRKSVFETNSSSSHSLTLSVGDVLPMPFTKAQLRDGAVTVGLGDYNWEWHRYYTPLNKIQYLLTQALLGSGEYGGSAIPRGDSLEVTRELCEKNARAATLCAVVKEHTGCDLVFAPGATGGIDHDSVGNGMGLFSSTADLVQFIFSAESYIETGNDNSGPNKLISTDRGREHYYGAHYREPAADWVLVNLTNTDGLWNGQLATQRGAILSEERNSELFGCILGQATVVKASWKTVGPYAYFAYEKPLGKAMADLSKFGLKFSEHLSVSEAFKPQRFDSKSPRTTVLTLEMRMPAELAVELELLIAEPEKVAKPVKARKKSATKEA